MDTRERRIVQLKLNYVKAEGATVCGEVWEDTVWSSIEEARLRWPNETYREIMVIENEN